MNEKTAKLISDLLNDKSEFVGKTFYSKDDNFGKRISGFVIKQNLQDERYWDIKVICEFDAQQGESPEMTLEWFATNYSQG
jgi:hypothetical protein